MANRPIPVSQANEMMGLYVAYMKGLGVNMTQQTHTISFTSAELLKWMIEVEPYTDEFRICEGLYAPGHEKAGRITTIIWPYKNGSPAFKTLEEEGKDGGGGTPINPYNEGTSRP